MNQALISPSQSGHFSVLNYPFDFMGRSAALYFMKLALVLFALLIPMAGLYFFDDRVIYDINIWVKPFKFTLSFAVYALTLGVLSTFIDTKITEKAWFRAYTGVIVFSICYEVAWGAGAATFGVRSHFNTDTVLMNALYATAGISALLLTSGALVFGVLIKVNNKLKIPDAMKFSLWTSSILMCVLTLITAGYMSSQTSHFVGGNMSDVEAFPLVGWATDGGDLRVPHFFATHIVHVIPLLTLVALKSGVRSIIPTASALIIYVAFVFYTFYEAISGYPFMSLLLKSL